MTDQPQREGWKTDARELHRTGYTHRDVWARWAVEAFKELRRHLGECEPDWPIPNLSYCLTDADWDEVASLAESISSTARCVAGELRAEKWEREVS